MRVHLRQLFPRLIVAGPQTQPLTILQIAGIAVGGALGAVFLGGFVCCSETGDVQDRHFSV